MSRTAKICTVIGIVLTLPACTFQVGQLMGKLKPDAHVVLPEDEARTDAAKSAELASRQVEEGPKRESFPAIAMADKAPSGSDATAKAETGSASARLNTAFLASLSKTGAAPDDSKKPVEVAKVEAKNDTAVEDTAAIETGGGPALASFPALTIPDAAARPKPRAAVIRGTPLDEKVQRNLRLASAARLAGDWSSAIRIYNRLTKTHPQHQGLRLEFGETLMEAGRHREALAQFELLLAENRNLAEALRGKGRVLLALQKTALAEQSLRRAHELVPGDTVSLNALGVALDVLGRTEEARSHYAKALRTDPDNAAVLNNLGLSHILSADYERAIEILLPLASVPDAAPRVRQNLALAYGLSGRESEASRVARIDLGDAAVRGNLEYYRLLRDRIAGAPVPTPSG